MNQKKQVAKYVLSDYLTALLAWFLFYVFRRIEIDLVAVRDVQMFVPMYDARLTMLLVPFFWLCLYYVSGYYNSPFFKSRLAEFFTTLTSVFLGSLVVFFGVLMDDAVASYTFYYVSFSVYFILHFTLTYAVRLTITTHSAHQIHTRKIGLKTLVLGMGDKAAKLDNQLASMKQSLGYMVVGFVALQKNETRKVEQTRVLGSIVDINNLLNKHNVDVVIIAVDDMKEDEVYQLIQSLWSKNIQIKIVPSLFEILIGSAKIKSIYAVPLIDLLEVQMSDVEQNLKRIVDVVVAVVMLLIGLPFFAFFALRIKLDSAGSIIYKQQRIGLHGEPFMMYKFRTMYEDAEQDGVPQLSSKNDDRITPFGRFMRKYRFDELPQFYNVLKGDMSLIGPRPERSYFVEQIVQVAPYYYRLFNVRPGITSWGMVKFGYANTVEKMVERAHFDISYIENMSLLIDGKILIYTIKTIVTGRGI
ncbi:MAG: sugar transferase [Paludibacteraceae bacterium]|nr:sugar transferase [Paludibacteraceae bacterium]MBP6284963.1 sugar transferase [Paludibacteraceae bacterium]